MLTMKQYLILVGVLGSATAQPQGTPAPAKQVAVAHAAAAPAPAPAPAKVAAPRQLSTEQKAELRRQLYQYSRVSVKGH
jgi:hypothetical protein